MGTERMTVEREAEIRECLEHQTGLTKTSCLLIFAELDAVRAELAEAVGTLKHIASYDPCKSKAFCRCRDCGFIASARGVLARLASAETATKEATQ